MQWLLRLVKALKATLDPVASGKEVNYTATLLIDPHIMVCFEGQLKILEELVFRIVCLPMKTGSAFILVHFWMDTHCRRTISSGVQYIRNF